jgi:hypothetical protein
MYIDMSFPRPSLRPRLGILVTWLLIDLILLTESITDAVVYYTALLDVVVCCTILLDGAVYYTALLDAVVCRT